MTGDNTTAAVLGSATTTAAGAALIPETCNDIFLTALSYALIGLGLLILLSYIAMRIAKRLAAKK